MIHSNSLDNTSKQIMKGYTIYKPDLLKSFKDTYDYKYAEWLYRFEICEELDKIFNVETALQEEL